MLHSLNGWMVKMLHSLNGEKLLYHLNPYNT